MPTPRIRADHDSLKRIAQIFAQEAEITKNVLGNLKNQMAVLQNGDWIGKGATAFYSEMTGQVLPTMNRLASALNRAAEVTREISAVMQQAERDAATLFVASAESVSSMTAPIGSSFSGGLAVGTMAKSSAGAAASGGGSGGATSVGNATVTGGATGAASVTLANYHVSSQATAIPESEWERQWESVANKKPRFREKYGAEWGGNWIDDTPMQDIRVTKDAQGHVKVLSYKANMAIDSDGDAPASLHLDADHQRGLALGGDHTWVNPVEIPYIAVPPEFTRAAAGNVNAHEGDLVLVRYGGKSVYAIVADVGPNFKAGEASIRTAQELGIDSDPSHGGISNSHPDVEYIVLPGSGQANNIKNSKPDFDQIQELGQKAFDQAKADGLVD